MRSANLHRKWMTSGRFAAASELISTASVKAA